MSDKEILDWLSNEKNFRLVNFAYGGWRRLFGKKDTSNWWPTLRECVINLSKLK